MAKYNVVLRTTDNKVPAGTFSTIALSEDEKALVDRAIAGSDIYLETPEQTATREAEEKARADAIQKEADEEQARIDASIKDQKKQREDYLKTNQENDDAGKKKSSKKAK